jgi:hypothetical protein
MDREQQIVSRLTNLTKNINNINNYDIHLSKDLYFQYLLDVFNLKDIQKNVRFDGIKIILNSKLKKNSIQIFINNE